MTTQCKNINTTFDLLYAVDQSKVFSDTVGSIRLLNLNVSYGIGSNSSSMDLDVVVDQCASPTTVVNDNVGRAVNFKCKPTGFYFGGIVHTSTYSESSSGFIFKFKIIDPRKILDNVSVLLKDYYCNDAFFATLPNFINFAYLKEGITCAVCPPGNDSENWPKVNGNCSGFGTSGPGNYSSQNGISISKILQIVQANSFGRIFTTSGADRLKIDLNKLIPKVPVWSKTDNTSASLGSIIDQAAEDAACDIFTTLERDVITVWPIDRSVSFSISPVEKLIKQAKDTGTLISSEDGRQELYEVSNKIILGDRVNYLSEINVENNGDGPAMMLGYLPDGSVARAAGIGFKDVPINITIINQLLINARKNPIGVNNTFKISEREILASSSLNTWKLYGLCIDPNNSLCNAIIQSLGVGAGAQNLINLFRPLEGPAGGANAAPQVNIVNNNGAQVIRGWQNCLKAIVGAHVNDVVASKTMEECWTWFDLFIGEYYGKKWLIPLRQFCVFPGPKPDVIHGGESGPYLLSDIPSNDGYPSPTQLTRNNILGLTNLQFFETTEGKYSGFVKIPNKKTQTIKINPNRNVGNAVQPEVIFDFEKGSQFLKDDNVVTEDGDVFTKISTEAEIHLTNNRTELLVETQLLTMLYNPNLQNGIRAELLGLGALAALMNPDLLDQPGFIDITTLNIYKLRPMACRFDEICLPMKSNLYCYGPWASSKNTIGSTDVQADSSLNPWNYGGYQLLNTVGNALATDAIRLSNKEFSGSYTLAEPPAWNANYFVTNYGIIVDSINTVYGSQGVTSTYSFKTYTPKFAQWGRAIADSVQRNIKNNNQIISRFKEIQKKAIIDARASVRKANRELNKLLFPGDPNLGIVEASPVVYIAGGFLGNINRPNNDGGVSLSDSPVVVENKLSQAQIDSYSAGSSYASIPSESSDGPKTINRFLNVGIHKQKTPVVAYSDKETFLNCSIMSIEGLFTPISLLGREGGLSRYSEYQPYADSPDRPRSTMPPIFKKLDINQKYLNPISSFSILQTWDDRKGISDYGFNINYLSYGDNVDESLRLEAQQFKDDYGFFGLRGPLVLQSWGYDTEGKPIPNIIDSPADTENGKFRKNGTKNKFMTNWLSNPKTWPVGPIDLRWDRERGVWVSGGSTQQRIVVAQLVEDLNSLGSAQAILLNPSADNKPFYENYSIWGENGENIGSALKSKPITIYDYLSRKICKGTRVYAWYEDGKYIVLETSSIIDDDLLQPQSQSEPAPIPGVLGIDEDACLTIYPFTDCEESPSESPPPEPPPPESPGS